MSSARQKQRSYSASASGSMWPTPSSPSRRASSAGRSPGRRRSCARAAAPAGSGRTSGSSAIASAMSTSSYMSSVGTMSIRASRSTRSGWSRARRCATRPPRSWPATEKRSWPSVAHQADHVGGHRPLAVQRMVASGVAPAGLPSRHSRAGRARRARSVGASAGRHPVPHRVRLRVAVQQQQRRLRLIAPGAREQLHVAGGCRPSANPSNQAMVGAPQKIDRPLLLANSSSACVPSTELPLGRAPATRRTTVSRSGPRRRCRRRRRSCTAGRRGRRTRRPRRRCRRSASAR